MSLFSKPGPPRDRLLKVLERGTLLLSVLNFLEIARTQGDTATNIATFLDGVGIHHAPITVSPKAAKEREQKLMLDPWRDTVHLPHLLREPRVAGRPAELARRVHEPWATQTLAEWENIANELARLLEEARANVRVGNLKLDHTNDVPPGPLNANEVHATLAQRLVRGSLNLERHQVDDLLHTCVPATYADVVFLDKKTKDLLAGVPIRARVFHPGEVDVALKRLEALLHPTKT